MSHHPARAMYDQIEETLTSITMQLRAAIRADAGMPVRWDARPNPLARAGGWARRVTAELGSVLLDTLGLAATIEWHLHQFQKCTGILYELRVQNAGGFDLPEEYSASVYDIYNEALSNVARHAGASKVAIALTITPHEVTLVVADDGIGLRQGAASTGAGGLAGMRAWSQAHKGFCEVIGARNAGTTVTVSLPVARVP